MNRWSRRETGCAVALLIAWLVPLCGEAQLVEAEPQVVTVPRGSSKVVTHPSRLERVSIADPEIADAVPVSATEVIVNGKTAGSTSLLLWGVGGSSAAYAVRVVANAEYVEEELGRLLPGSNIQASAAGNAVVLSGAAKDSSVAEKAVALATSLLGGGESAQVIDHIALADPPQVLLQVRFAEVNRSVVRELGFNLFRLVPGDDQFGISPRGEISGEIIGGVSGEGGDLTLSDTVNVFLFHQASNVTALIRALRDEGAFRSLAEPNLLAFPGEEASFLAGGEFPFPVLQGQTDAITIEFKEFGIRLNFLPEIANSGGIRMKVAPEVSQLDFASGLQISGFLIPALLVRRAETVVELQDGQTFAIAGLIDSTTARNASKIPWLGEIPILGALFRSTEHRNNRTELLVMVTPHLVHAQDEAPQLPTGEPRDWQWDRYMRSIVPLQEPAMP